MAGILKLWLQSWQSVQTEALAAAQLAGNAGTSVGSKAFAFLNSVASSSTMGVAMLSVTLTTVVSTASVVYDVVLDPESPLQVQSVSFDSGIITDEEGNFIYNVETESQMFDLMQAVHNPDEEHTIFTPWEPETEQILNTGLSADELKEEEELPNNISSNGDNENIPPDDVITAAPLTDTEPRQTTNETNDTGIQRLIADSPPVVTLPPPVITITRQPDATLEVSEGSIAGGLIVEARLIDRAALLSYQWYQSSGSNTGGSAVPGATGHVLFLPTDLKAGTYSFYVVISVAGGNSITSNVSVVTVTPAVAPLHYLTIIDGGNGSTQSGMRAQGSLQDLDPGRRFGFGFTGWTITSGSVNLINYPRPDTWIGHLPTHLFTMPAGALTLTATWEPITPEITITLQPNSHNASILSEGSGLLVEASVNTGEELTFQWYQSSINSNTNGTHTPLEGANEFSLTYGRIISNINVKGFTQLGPLYYYVEISSPGSPTIKSNVAVITVTQNYNVTVVSEGDHAIAQHVDDFKWWHELPFEHGDIIDVSPGRKDGYIFKGWNISPNLSIYLYDSLTPGTAKFTMPANDVTLTAIWEKAITKYTVTVVSEGAQYQNAVDAITDEDGSFFQDTTIRIDPGVRTGYSFTGWTVTSGNVSLHNMGGFTFIVMPAGNVTVTANWVKTYEVKIIGGGPDAFIRNTANFAGPPYIQDTSVWISAGTRAGHTFSHWEVTPADLPYNNIPNFGTLFDMPANDVTFTAIWDPPLPQLRTVEIIGGGGVTGAGQYVQGDLVAIQAQQAGHTVVSITSSPSVNFETYNLDWQAFGAPAIVAFEMPNYDVTITVNWDPPIIGASIQLSLDLTDPPTPPIGDSTEPPEPETGEPAEPPEPPSGNPPVGDSTEPPEPTSGDGTEPTDPLTGDTTEPPEPETGDPSEQGTTNPPEEPTQPPAEEPQD